VILADQPGDSRSTANPSGHIDHLARIVQRRAKRTALMRAMIVEMTFILGQDPAHVPFTVNQQMIEALAA
jgi:hypothetical protein